MTVQGENPVEEKVDPSAMYSGISMADDRINQLQSESNKMRSDFKILDNWLNVNLENGVKRIQLE